MEFLKKLFAEGEALTYEQLQQKATAAKLNIVDLSDGKYVSQVKYKAATDQVADLQGQLAARDTDLTDLQTKLTAAQADASKLPDTQAALTALQTKYTTDQATWQEKVQKQMYEFQVREKAGAIKFTSAAAKRDFISQAIGKDFKQDGEKLLGFDEFVTSYTADNPGAISVPDPEPDDNKEPPRIVLPKGKPESSDKAVFGFNFNGVRPRPKED
mgnify:CR=1 FL=1